MIKAVAFDFDGTLTDPMAFGLIEKIRGEIERIAEDYISPVEVRRLAHQGIYVIEMIYEVEAMIREAGQRFTGRAFATLRRMEIEAADGKALYPYVRDVLRTLRHRGVKIGIITRNCPAAVEKVFPDMGTYVDALKTREDVRHVKPSPDHVEAILEALKVTARDAILVGDHPTDMLGGRASGASTLGVLTGRTSRADLQDAGADYVADDIRGLLEIVPGKSAF
ncbi:MAG: HAD family hydrolase [Syntrophorhabdales bacterium]|jgi:phosphoglycolate phosphatase